MLRLLVLLTLAPLAAHAQTVSVGSRPVALASADVDGDGDLDLVVLNGQLQTNPQPPADLSVLLNDGQGRFAEAARYATPGRIEIATGDLDGDGDADVAVTTGFAVAVHLSTAGVLSPATVYETVDAGQVAFTRNLTLADLTGDGVLDLAVANDNGSSVSVFVGVGDGTFLPRRDVTGLMGGSTGIVAADLDGDADADLAVVASGSGDLYVLRNPGDGAFAGAPPSGRAGGNPLDVVAADLDGDGDLDLGIADDGGFYTRAGDGTGAFAPTVRTPVPSASPFGGLSAIVAGDFDGDGRADLAAAQAAESNLVLLLSGTPGLTRVPVGVRPEGVTSGDFDGDGDLDLASADTGANTVTVRLNAGSGTFPTAGEALPTPVRASVSVSPNPATDRVTVALPPGAERLVVTDLLGREMLSQRARLGAEARMDVSAWPAGVYAVRVDGRTPVRFTVVR